MSHHKRPERYRADQAPGGKNEAEELEPNNVHQQQQQIAVSSGVGSVSDRRLARLQAMSNENDSTSRRRHRAEVVIDQDEEEMRPARRRGAEPSLVIEAPSSTSIHSRQAPILAPETSAEDMELDEEYVDSRREALKAMIKEQGAHQVVSDEEMTNFLKEEESSEEEEESEEEYQEETMIRPTFVSKNNRVTIKEKERLQKEEEMAREAEKKSDEDRKKQTLEMIAQEDEREKEEQKENMEGNISDIEANDDPEEEYELWKIRELKRLKRDQTEAQGLTAEREGVESRRMMTDEEVMRERRAETRAQGKAVEEFKPRKLMQRGYHKGAFFAGDLDKLQQQHDWDAPTGEDNWFNRETGPESHKTKKYGKVATKFKGLKAEDTTQRELNPWIQTDRELQRQKREKLAGYHGSSEYRRNRY